MTGVIRDILIDALNEAADVLDDPQLAPKLLGGQDVPLTSMELDSLSILEAIMHLEDRLGIELDTEEVMEQGGVSALVDYLDAKAKAAGRLG